MKLYDISWPISPVMTAYKNKAVVSCVHHKEFPKDLVRESSITLGSHSGTHIDAPAHFIREGASIDQLDLSRVVGTCVVYDLTLVKEAIKRADLEPLSINPGERVLFKTRNSFSGATDPFNYEFVYLSAAAADYLVEKKVAAVGIDYLGIERNQPDHETHKLLGAQAIPIIEGLRLEHVEAGSYFLCCLPLAVQGNEAAPARAILIQDLDDLKALWPALLISGA